MASQLTTGVKAIKSQLPIGVRAMEIFNHYEDMCESYTRSTGSASEKKKLLISIRSIEAKFKFPERQFQSFDARSPARSRSPRKLATASERQGEKWLLNDQSAANITSELELSTAHDTADVEYYKKLMSKLLENKQAYIINPDVYIKKCLTRPDVGPKLAAEYDRLCKLHDSPNEDVNPPWHAYRDLVVERTKKIFAVHSPDKLKSLPNFLSKYHGHEQYFYGAVCKMCNVKIEPMPVLTAPVVIDLVEDDEPSTSIAGKDVAAVSAFERNKRMTALKEKLSSSPAPVPLGIKWGERMTERTRSKVFDVLDNNPRRISKSPSSQRKEFLSDSFDRNERARGESPFSNIRNVQRVAERARSKETSVYERKPDELFDKRPDLALPKKIDDRHNSISATKPDRNSKLTKPQKNIRRFEIEIDCEDLDACMVTIKVNKHKGRQRVQTTELKGDYEKWFEETAQEPHIGHFQNVGGGDVLPMRVVYTKK